MGGIVTLCTKLYFLKGDLTVIFDMTKGFTPVPPLRSDFQDFGPFPDFFDESGPILQQKSGF